MRVRFDPGRVILPNESSALPFSGFLDLLKRRGFAVGVEHHLRLVALLERAGAECGPAELKQLIAPLFATNEKEQAQFYRTFDDYFPLLRQPARKDIEGASTTKPTRRMEADRGRRSSWLRATSLLILLLTAAVVVGYFLFRIQGEKTDPTKDQTGFSTPVTSRNVTSGDRPLPASPAAQSSVAPAPAPDRIVPVLVDNRPAILWASVLLPLAVFGGCEWRRFLKRRQLVLEHTRGLKPPFTWPIRIDPRPLAYLRSEQFYKVARKLRRRQIAEYHRLDIARTIEATIAASGYLSFQYRPDSRMPEYLILIDRASARDHQAILFDQLTQAFHREGLFVTRYFFEGDPRVCWSERATSSVSLTDLQKTFSEHRLLIFGRGERMLDPVTGELSDWSSIFLEWHERALLTPAFRANWNQPEQALAEQFLLFPATLEGIEELAECFDSSVPAEAELDPYELTAPEIEPAIDLDKLRTYLGDEVFRWLSACATYPELHWDLTLLIGSLPALGAQLVTEKNLFRLLQLPWFRSGSIPSELRLQLLATLDPKVEAGVRGAIVQALEKSPAPEESFAAQSRRLEIVLQENLLGRGHSANLKSALATAPLDSAIREYVLLHETRRGSPLVFALPERMRSLFFEKGLPGLGLTFKARLSLTSAAVALFLAAISVLVPGPNTTAVVIGISQYEDESSRLNYAAKDARSFAFALRNGAYTHLFRRQSAFLYDQDAATERIKDALESAFASQSHSTDHVFYYRGQGGNESRKLIMFPADTDIHSGASPFTSEDLMSHVKPALVRGDRVFLFIDTAYAGAAGFDVNNVLEELREPKGTIFAFLASTPEQVVMDAEQSFTYFVIRGFQGAADANNDGQITAGELQAYLEDKVTASSKGEQLPLFAGNGKPDAVLPHLLGPTLYPGEQLAAPTAPAPTATQTSRTSPPELEENPPVVSPNEQRNIANQPLPLSEPPMTPETSSPSSSPSPGPDSSPNPTIEPGTTTTAATPPVTSDGEGGIDIESAGQVPSAARAVLKNALARETLSPRNWAVAAGKGPSDRITVQHYFPEDATKAETIRASLSQVLGEIKVEAPARIEPPKSYRAGHIDIWLPNSAIKLLMQYSNPKSGKANKGPTKS